MSELTSAILISAALCLAPEAKHTEAYNKYLEATYAQTGLDRYRKTLEKQYVPQEVKLYGGYLAIMMKVYKDQQVKLAWTF